MRFKKGRFAIVGEGLPYLAPYSAVEILIDVVTDCLHIKVKHQGAIYWVPCELLTLKKTYKIKL